jgi:hypothetical protein
MRATLAVLVLFAATSAAAVAQTQPPALVAFAKAYAKIASYQTTAHVYQVQGSDSQNSVYDYTFTKPSTISMSVVSGANSGTTVSWSGGTDKLVTTLRGMTLVQLSFGAILAHAQETAGKITAGTSTLGGAIVNMINLDVANPHGDNDLTREVLYLSQSTNLPVRVDGFIGNDLVQTISFENTVTN